MEKTTWRTSAASAALFGCFAGAASAGPPLESGLFLNEGRFSVSATWTTAEASGAGRGERLTGQTGFVWFFTPDNVELVVKVLDACGEPAPHFWVFAAGLTDVGVELEVTDLLSGEVWRHANPLGEPFPPVLDTAAFATCDRQQLCGQGTPAEIVSSPRADAEAEGLAIMLGGSLGADEAIYRRLARDIPAIREMDPELAEVPFATPFRFDEVQLQVPPATLAQIEDGTFAEWDCLNRWYRVREIATCCAEGLDGRVIRLQLEILADTRRIAADYAALPGVVSAEPGVTGHLLNTVPGTICAVPDDEVWHYFFRDWGHLAPGAARYFTVPSGGEPAFEGVWDGGDRPPWADLYEACLESIADPYLS